MTEFSTEQSTQRLHDNITNVLNRYFPYEHNGYTFELTNITFKRPDMSHEAQEEAFHTDQSLETFVKGTLTIKKDGKPFGNPRTNITISKIPHITDRGTYIIKGNENVMLNQMTLRPGVYIHHLKGMKTKEINAEVRPSSRRAQRFKITFDTLQPKITIVGLGMEYGKEGGTINFISVLRALGATDQEIKDAVGGEQMYNALMKGYKEQSIRQLYEKTHRSPFTNEQEAKEKIINFFTNDVTFDENGQKVNSVTLNSSHASFGKEAMLQTLRQLFQEWNQPDSTPDPDDLRFKQVESGEDVIARYFEGGLGYWMRNLKKLADENFKSEYANPTPQLTIYKGIEKLYNSSLAENDQSANPLALFQARHKLTMGGEGGLSVKAATVENRNIQDTFFGKIDPLETSQSDKMGLVQHLAMDATIKNGRIFSKFYRVDNGEIDKTKVIDDLDPIDEYEEYVAFNDPRFVQKQDGKWVLTSDKIPARHRGEFVEVEKNKVTYIDKTRGAALGNAINLIPFVNHDDGARVLMGANMQKQSMPLENPDIPLVQSVIDDDTEKTMEEDVAEKASFLLKSPVGGTVKKIADNYIEIEEDGGFTTKVKRLNYFTTGKMGGYIHHKPVVKVGDKVEAGGLLADGWQSKNGQLALGKNVLVAYMPFEGYNFEDGVVVSETFSQKMASEEVKPVVYEIKEGTIHGDPEVKNILASLDVSKGLLDKLDEDGVIQKGQEIHPGDIVVGVAEERTTKEFSKAEQALNRAFRREDKIFNLPSDQWRDVSKRAEGYQKGKVIDVKKVKNADGSMKVSIKLLAFKPMEIGDKLAGRHGNKGTITEIRPDAEMPHTKEGKPVELIFSPLAVPSRKNMGQLLEINAGLIAEKKGLPSYKVRNFNPNERERIIKELEEIGYKDGKQELINPVTGQPYENTVTVGPMYIMKLKHKVESKLTARNYIGGLDDKIFMSPKKVSGSIDGERRNPQSVGGMEFWSLTSAGAVNNIHEMTTLKSDGGGDRQMRMAVFNAIRRGERLPEPLNPASLKVLRDNLYASGLQLDPLKGEDKVTLDEKFTSLMLQPLRRDTVEQLKPKPITTGVTRHARMISLGKGGEQEGGLYDPRIFGEEGDKWGRIDFPYPMPNPLFLDNNGPRPYEAMLLSKGIKNSDLVALIDKGKYIVMEPGNTGKKKYDIVEADELDKLEDEGKDFRAETGGFAIHELLKGVNLREEFNFAEQRVKDLRDKPNKLKELSAAQRQLRVLGSALDNQMKPTDFMMDFLPVLPTKYRQPVKVGNSDRTTEDEITLLYQKVANRTLDFKDVLDSFDGDKDEFTREKFANFQKGLYQDMKYVIGVGKPFVDQSKKQEWKGIMHTLKGKHGLLRDKMQSKMQDYSGRSVITVDPLLNMDEVGLPEDMIAEMWQPQISGKLMAKRYNPKQIKHFMANHTDEWKEAVMEVAEEQPVILNRQPSLHRHSAQGFKVKIRWNEDKRPNLSIGLNPLVVTGFNADFDGDTMAVHVPIGEAAKKEVFDKLMPSKNLLNPTNNGIIMELKHEMQLGLFYMTRDRMATGTPKKFKSWKELRKAYEKGEVKTFDAVQMDVPTKGTITDTAGKHLFNGALPPKFIDFKKNVNMDGKKINKLMNEIMSDPIAGPMAVVNTMNTLKSIGFKSATYSGLSIGIRDFDPVAKIDKVDLLRKAEQDSEVAKFINDREVYEQKKTDFAQTAIKNMIGKGMLEGFNDDNSVKIMMVSGARGNAGQVTSMAGMVGVGKDVTEKRTRPIQTSLLEGLSPVQFWDLAYDSRKGIFDKSIATRDPGALTRRIWMTNKQTMITEPDCGDKQGIVLHMEKETDQNALRGRVLLAPFHLPKGGVISVTGKPITIQDLDKVKSAAKGEIRVRSPLTCKSSTGICQVCYGAKPGSMTNDLIEIGEPVGSIAAQALGEPSQQAIMRTFHTGGATTVGGAFKRIEEILDLSKVNDKNTKAILVEESGVVDDIIPHPNRTTTVVIGKKRYNLKDKPLSPKVRKGVHMNVGESLTLEYDGDNPVTFKDPRDILRLQGPEEAKTYLIGAMEEAFKFGGISDTDRRHMELVVSNMTDRAVVTNGGTSPFVPGQTVTRRAVDHFNLSADRATTVPLDYTRRMNVIGSVAAVDYSDRKQPSKWVVRKGEEITPAIWDKLKADGRAHIKVKRKPVSFQQELHGVKHDTQMATGNWLENAAYQNAARDIGAAAALGMKDHLDNPLTRQMTGLKGNFADGFKEWQETNNWNFI